MSLSCPTYLKTTLIARLTSSSQVCHHPSDIRHICSGGIIVIQGTLDVKKEIPQQQIVKTLDFCKSLFSATWQPEDRTSVLKKIDDAQKEDLARGANAEGPTAMERLQMSLTEDEKSAFKYIETRKHMRLDDTLTINSFVSDVVDGRRLRLERGRVGLELISEALPLVA